MKKVFFIANLFISQIAISQLVNNGGTIVVQSGASIFCTGNFTNNGGTFTNNGRLEVQGNFVNSGTYNSTTDDDSLIMSGSGNTVLNLGSATLRFLTINKASHSDLMTLASSITVANKLDYLSGTLSTDYLLNPSFAVNAPSSAVFNFAPGREIVGNVRRTGWSNGSTVVFNGANMQLSTNGGTSPTDMMVTMLPGAFGGDPSQNEREVKRRFLFTPSGGSGYTADVRFPYQAGELNSNVEGNLVPWNLISSEWNARLTPVNRDAGADWLSTTGISATLLAQEWKLADPRYTFNVTAFLRGPWNAGTGTMTTNYNAAGLLPTSQPYNISPINYNGNESVSSIPNSNIVDWVLVEFRKPSTGLAGDANPSTIIGRKAAFLLNNGSVVDLDGVTPINFDITKQGSGFIVLRHLNHLGVMSNAVPSNTLGTYSNNFASLAGAYKSPGASSDPLIPLPSSSSFGLWAGDANRGGTINATDLSVVRSAITSSLSGYLSADVNLSNSINATDLSIIRSTITSSGTSSVSRQGAPIRSNLPEHKNTND